MASSSSSSSILLAQQHVSRATEDSAFVNSDCFAPAFHATLLAEREPEAQLSKVWWQRPPCVYMASVRLQIKFLILSCEVRERENDSLVIKVIVERLLYYWLSFFNFVVNVG